MGIIPDEYKRMAREGLDVAKKNQEVTERIVGLLEQILAELKRRP